MQVRTLFLYLIGNRRAILDIAANRRALWIGLLFVLSAGFAREYDGQDLLREPWHLVVPLGASLGASFLLFLVACGSVFLRGDHPPPFLSAYRTFLTLFWMTAPLAWLYAIPYERFLSAGAATSANLWTLALVAAWRVLLMVRVVSVITGRSPWAALFLVMVFADAVAMTAVYYMPKPVISFMGGIRLTESEAAVAGAVILVFTLGILSAPLWLIGGLIAFGIGKWSWQVPAAATLPPSRGLWWLAIGSVVIWLPILPGSQSEQLLRVRVEREMKAGQINEGLDLMSTHEQSDFPPHWDPPPRIGYEEKSPHILAVMEVLANREDAPWVRAVYLEKFRRYVAEESGYYSPLRDEELGRVVRILQRIPEGPGIAAGLAQRAESRLSPQHGQSTELSVEVRDNLQALVELAKKSGTPRQP